MPPLTLGQAAKECGKQKSTLLDAIKAGRLSASRDDKNQWQIDPSELFRVYPPKQATERDTTTAEHNQTPEQLAQMLKKEQEERERERAQLERERRLLESQLEDLKADRDHWRQQATNLLTHQPEPKPAETTPPEQPEPDKGALFRKIFRGWKG
ncbi:hypothetical protein ACH50O_23540 (plasmid) [Methylomonas sp. 2BW1-5-20]|uniref:hypothetical protein n=1 Tax=Methylomonas sp. 2BW1-5-20 TaxID=3376686 RepID=UPI00404DB46B